MVSETSAPQVAYLRKPIDLMLALVHALGRTQAGASTGSAFWRRLEASRTPRQSLHVTSKGCDAAALLANASNSVQEQLFLAQVD